MPNKMTRDSYIPISK